jgi:L-glyceraldehyde 3-phosphate reductase
MTMDSRPLGDSGLTVSRLSLGSWRTFERISRDAGLEVMRAARDAGITLLDDARYDDETGAAPIPTGYSEVVFGELFRAAGWPRDETVVTNKLWWEHWPEESATEELQGSLGRMGFDHVDVIYANAPINGLELDELVATVGGLIKAGLTRAWAIVNWPADQLLAASAVAAAQGVPQPCAAQLPYNVAYPHEVESPEMQAALTACRAPVVASYVLFGGVLTGKYDHDPADGRAAGTLDDPKVAHGVVVGRRLAALADSAGVTPARLAFAFALAAPSVASVLFGATRPEQVEENVSALDLVDHLNEPTWRELRWIGAELG